MTTETSQIDTAYTAYLNTQNLRDELVNPASVINPSELIIHPSEPGSAFIFGGPPPQTQSNEEQQQQQQETGVESLTNGSEYELNAGDDIVVIANEDSQHQDSADVKKASKKRVNSERKEFKISEAQKEFVRQKFIRKGCCQNLCQFCENIVPNDHVARYICSQFITIRIERSSIMYLYPGGLHISVHV